MSDLGARRMLTPSGITRVVVRLEEQGLVRREPDPADGRAAFAVLTRPGPRGAAARAGRPPRHGARALPRPAHQPRTRAPRPALREGATRRRQRFGLAAAETSAQTGSRRSPFLSYAVTCGAEWPGVLEYPEEADGSTVWYSADMSPTCALRRPRSAARGCSPSAAVEDRRRECRRDEGAHERRRGEVRRTVLVVGVVRRLPVPATGAGVQELVAGPSTRHALGRRRRWRSRASGGAGGGGTSRAAIASGARVCGGHYDAPPALGPDRRLCRHHPVVLPFEPGVHVNYGRSVLRIDGLPKLKELSVQRLGRMPGESVWE